MGSGDTDLTDVGIASGKSVWAVGASFKGQAAKVLVERWTPGGVKVVKSPSSGSAAVLGLEVVSGRNLWAVGVRDLTGAGRPLIEHWNGKKWAVVASPGPAGSSLRGDRRAFGFEHLGRRRRAEERRWEDAHRALERKVLEGRSEPSRGTTSNV